MSLFAMPPAMAVYVLFLALLTGACMASALSCLAMRICRKESWLEGRSRCDVCGHILGIRDLIPIVSYLVLKGRCRYCREKIGRSVLAGEVFLALVFAALVLRFGITWELPKALVLVMVLYPASLCDMETFEIPDRFAVIGSAGWLALLPFSQDWKMTLFMGILGSFAVTALVALVSVLMSQILKKDAMGGGDLKLYALTGLYFGPLLNLLNLMVSCMIGLALHKMLGVRAVRDEEVPEGAFPFGPAIALSALFCLLAGQGLVNWYLNLLGF